jgi:outer membrane lipoprotein SlyB
MKRFVLVAALATLSVGGCANVPTSPNAMDNVDTAKVASVNRMARLQGILLQWVNYPIRKDASTAPTPTSAGT